MSFSIAKVRSSLKYSLIGLKINIHIYREVSKIKRNKFSQNIERYIVLTVNISIVTGVIGILTT